MLARAPSSSITRDVPVARRRADRPPARSSFRQQVAVGDGPPLQEFPGCISECETLAVHSARASLVFGPAIRSGGRYYRLIGGRVSSAGKVGRETTADSHEAMLLGDVVARRRRHCPDHPVSLPISLHAVSSTSHALRSISDTGQSYLHANRATHQNKSLDNSSPRKSKEESLETASDGRLKSIGLKSLGINGNGVEKSGSNVGRKKSEAMLDREGNNSSRRKISSPLRAHRREPCPSPTSPEPTWNINSKTELRELRIVEDTEASREINTNNNVSERSNLFNSTNSSIVNKHNILAMERSPSHSPENKIRCLPTVAHYSSLPNHSMKNGKRETSRSCSGSPVRHPSSILKKKSLDESHTVSKPVASQLPNHNNHMPVSILKRKTSKDEAVSSSPVTFSPSVIEPTSSRSKKQGILKKRASLDESEVMRRRSCSPDIANFGTDEGSDFKPILRYHRRSSLEELVRRTQSPDPHPHSILKRKTSREDGEIEDRSSCSPEPQGILKRKSLTGSSSCGNSNSPHVSIAASVIAAAAGINPTDVFDNSEHMRPILKKKSSSEDSGTTDLISEVPRPILKKKPSIEIEELDDRPKKPILKISSRKSSQEEREVDSVGRHVLIRGRSLGTDSRSGSDCDIMKPILKQPSIENVQSRERSSSPRPRLSFCDNEGSISSESALPGSPTFEGVALRRRQRPASIVGVVRSNSAAADSELTTILSKRRSLEYNNPPNLNGDDKGNVLSSKSAKIDLERPKSPEGTRAERRLSVAERILTMESFFLEVSPPSTGAVPKQKAFHRDGKNKERFCTQPITMDEIQAFTRSESHQAFQKGILDIKSSMSNGLDIVSPSSVRSETQSSDVFSPASENSLLSSAEKVEGDVEAVLTARAMECERDDSEEKGSGLSRSNSVVAKASLFNQLEEQMKLSAEEAKSRRLPTRRAARYRDRKEEGNRFATQPVTSDEVQEAVRQSTSTLEENKDEEKADEDDPSKYSLAERVRLFNQKIMEERLLKVPEGLVQRPLARKQVVSTRFKTAPVITEDVESARRISPLAASMSNPLNPKLSGILKNTRDPDSLRSVPAEPSSPCNDNSDEESESENEMKGILKVSATPPPGTQTPELESFRHLKSVLKKETSAMSGKKIHTRKTLPKTNDPLRSILKPESKEWSTGEAPSTSEDSESGSGLSGDETKPAVPLSGKTTRSGSGVDIVSILHNVEAHAKQQRQANNKINLAKEEKAINKKNMSQEKENQKYTYQKNKATEIKTEITKKAVRDKLVGAEHRCSVHRKIESKQLSMEAKLSRKVVECPYGLKVVSNEKQKIGGVPESYEEKLRRQLDNQSSTNETTPPTSDGETSSSGGREVRRIIRNEAGVQRRKPVNKYHKER
uniref:Supervillin n=1 Tax=Timema douglasi TaxID=61478 RepID=A0A7R8VRH7_TIMDO|nr:unnamed protein product [Timema douglasi]